MAVVEIDLSCDVITHLNKEEMNKVLKIVTNSLKNKKEALDNKIDFEQLKNYYNQVFSKSMRVVTEKTRVNINKRIKEGYNKQDIKKVIDNASNDKFHEPNDFKHVTLEFLSRSDIFARYVSEKDHQQPRNLKLKQAQGQGHVNY